MSDYHDQQVWLGPIFCVFSPLSLPSSAVDLMPRFKREGSFAVRKKKGMPLLVWRVETTHFVGPAEISHRFQSLLFNFSIFSVLRKQRSLACRAGVSNSVRGVPTLAYPPVHRTVRRPSRQRRHEFETPAVGEVKIPQRLLWGEGHELLYSANHPSASRCYLINAGDRSKHSQTAHAHPVTPVIYMIGFQLLQVDL